MALGQHAQSGGLFASAPAQASALFAPAPIHSGGGLSGNSPPQSAGGMFGPSAAPAALPYEPDAKISFATASTPNTYGISTTFALPGKKALPSSSTVLHFMVSETQLSNITMTYTAVPKLSLAAYLTATITLPATAPPLPRGCKAFFTVDGTFLGQLPLPEKDENGALTLPLGVDDAVEVGYDKPIRHSEFRVIRSSEFRGVVRHEETVEFRRAWTVRNRRTKPIVLVVRDQVPTLDAGGKVKVRVVVPGEGDGEMGDVRMLDKGVVEWRFGLAAGETRREKLWWAAVPDVEAIVSLS